MNGLICTNARKIGGEGLKGGCICSVSRPPLSHLADGTFHKLEYDRRLGSHPLSESAFLGPGRIARAPTQLLTVTSFRDYHWPTIIGRRPILGRLLRWIE